MRIAQLAPLVESVPPQGYGGTELVVSLLTEALVEHGHQVTLFATGDSVTSGRLVSIAPAGLRKALAKSRHRWVAYDLKALLKLQEMQEEFDIIHNHMGYQALPFLDRLACPVITTNHNPISAYCADIYLSYPHLPYVAISNTYRSLNYPERLNYVATIHNGIDVDKYSDIRHNHRNYLLFIGRISSDKGTATAIDIACRLGLPLKIAGKIDLSDEEYFIREVKPKLSNPLIEFVGEVNELEKIELYGNAIATVYPINFEEPFGLVMAESLASGTPILGFDRGSVREVVSDGCTGIVAKSADEIVKRFSEIERISAKDCRMRASELFGKDKMAQRYEFSYTSLTKQISTREKAAIYD